MTRNQIDAGYKNSDFQTRPWIPLCEIAKGDVSVVFKVIDLEGTSLAAMKVEKIPQKEKKLKKKHIEKDILEVLRESSFSLHLIAHSYVNHIRVTVMTLAGPSLGVIKRLMNNKFSDSTILRLAIRTLLSLKDLHEHGYIHRDLEPDNIALSYCKSSRSVFLLDFGQAREYARMDKGKWILRAARDKIPFRGSVQYCSPKMHDEKELGRIDDLWSWLYIFMEMRVFLPWTDSTLSSYFSSRKRNELEETLNSDPFLTTFLPIVKIMKTSEFADRPDYFKIYEILVDKMIQIGVKWTDPMDYDMITARHNFFSTTPMNEEKMTEEQLAAAFQESIVPGGAQYVIGPLVRFYGVEKEKTKEEKENEKEDDKEKKKEKEKDVEKKKEKVLEKPKEKEKENEKEKPKLKEKGKSREVIAKEKDRKSGSQEKNTDKSSDAPSKNVVEKTSKRQKTAKQSVPPPPKKNTKTSSTSSVSHQTPPSVAEKPPSSLPSHTPPRSMKKKPARTPAKQKLKTN
ncbi:unnamed protein product [Caenorhabditis nigoni]